MKDLLELLKFLDEKLGEFTITTDRNYVEEDDLSLFITLGKEECLEFEDLKKISEFCDDLTVNTDNEGKLFLHLLFLPKKGE
ncbi:MAG: hypothetical protein DRJ03_04140 [Chloroflexi bacterium]|nr:MAG: hypothetical protein DRJ03_04140 [Chloroflexota bacterium]